MRAPVAATLNDALAIGAAVCKVDRYHSSMWLCDLVVDAWNRGTFQEMFERDWEHEWTDEQCQKIMAAWVAYRLER